MNSRNIAFFGFLLCTFVVCFDVGFAQDPLYTCPNDTIYNTNTTSGRIFRNNLDFLLSALTSNASQPNGFYNFTVGIADTAVYGLFLCRGDVNISACQVCVKPAASDVLRVCPGVKKATVWYDHCMLRYSNESIFSKVDESITWLAWNTNTVSADDKTLLDKVLGNTFDQIATRAAYDTDQSGKKFAVQEANFTAFMRKIYALGQCTPDLLGLDCERCLRDAISSLHNCCSSHIGGTAITPSCRIRYETYPYYDVSAPPPAPSPNLPPPAPAPPLPLAPAAARNKGNGGISTKTIVAIAVPATFVAIVSFVAAFFCIARRAKKIKAHIEAHIDGVSETTGVSNIATDAESLRCKFSEVQAYTNNFANENKLGEGGFGPVYKGTLPNGEIIAVKRLSGGSAQGAQEFINEIALVAKLQHRNLVRLLGYCLEGEEKMLIYEFVPNKSLDYYLFDREKQPLLGWLIRYKIIGGVARGLLYLHEDSRLKIIHRDLKASNVLLDQNMNPKIADFGLARLLENEQSEGNTSRIAGTFGYMAPEYAFHGLLSVKSDVYSFGVLVLEIISGKKNSSLQANGADDLLTYTWKQWRDGTPLAMVDPSIGNSYNRNEVIRCIQIGLLCVQEAVEQRPTVASIVLMLNSNSITLSIPNPPAFYGRSGTESFPREPTFADSGKSSTSISSVPDVSGNDEPITDVYGR